MIHKNTLPDMENPFAIIAARLEVIEDYLLDLKRTTNAATDDTATPIGRKVLNIDQLCEYADLKKQTVYKLTSAGEIPHSKRGKRIYFDRDAVDAWLLSNQNGCHNGHNGSRYNNSTGE